MPEKRIEGEKTVEAILESADSIWTDSPTKQGGTAPVGDLSPSVAPLLVQYLSSAYFRHVGTPLVPDMLAHSSISNHREADYLR